MQNRPFILIIIWFAVIIFVISLKSADGHIPESNNTQILKNKQGNLEIQFVYIPEIPIIDTFTTLNFSVTNLQSGKHIDDSVAQVTVTNGERLFKFENISVASGDFSVDYIFPDDGTHQILLRLDRNESIQLASFQVFVPHQTPPTLLDNRSNVIIALGILAGVAVITLIMLKKR